MFTQGGSWDLLSLLPSHHGSTEPPALVKKSAAPSREHWFWSAKHHGWRYQPAVHAGERLSPHASRGLCLQEALRNTLFQGLL